MMIKVTVKNPDGSTKVTLVDAYSTKHGIEWAAKQTISAERVGPKDVAQLMKEGVEYIELPHPSAETDVSAE